MSTRSILYDVANANEVQFLHLILGRPFLQTSQVLIGNTVLFTVGSVRATAPRAHWNARKKETVTGHAPGASVMNFIAQ